MQHFPLPPDTKPAEQRKALLSEAMRCTYDKAAQKNGFENYETWVAAILNEQTGEAKPHE